MLRKNTTPLDGERDTRRMWRLLGQLARRGELVEVQIEGVGRKTISDALDRHLIAVRRVEEPRRLVSRYSITGEGVSRYHAIAGLYGYMN